MNLLVRLIKIVLVFGLIGMFMVHTTFIGLFAADRWKRRRRWAYLTHRYARWMLKVMGVAIHTEGQIDVRRGNYLIVSNHLSYVDVLIIAASSPSCFVTSMEVRETPFLGHLCQLAGCLFVERRSRRWLAAEIEEVAEALRRGINVAVFPEATSTNGEGVRPFRRALYQAAVLARRPVQPACLNYLALNGECIGPSNRDTVFWYGTMSFLPHLWTLMSHARIDVGFTCLEALPLESDAEALTHRSYELVRSRFKPCLAG